MGRLFGIVAILAGIWAAAQIYTQGLDSAFGGALAGIGEPIVPLSELHSGGGRGASPPGRARAEPAERDDEVVQEEDPFAEKSTPITRLGAHIQGEIDGSYQERYGNQ